MISEADAEGAADNKASAAAMRTAVFIALKVPFEIHLSLPRSRDRRCSEPCCGAKMALVGAGFQDLGDLGDGEAKLVVGVVVVRAEPQAGVGTEVAQDLTLGELLVHRFEMRRAHRDGAAAAGRVARA